MYFYLTPYDNRVQVRVQTENYRHIIILGGPWHSTTTRLLRSTLLNAKAQVRLLDVVSDRKGLSQNAVYGMRAGIRVVAHTYIHFRSTTSTTVDSNCSHYVALFIPYGRIWRNFSHPRSFFFLQYRSDDECRVSLATRDATLERSKNMKTMN